MKLRTVQVKNFKCVTDSGEFSLDDKVTCLVGKNESGKTALLQALHKINPLVATEADFDELEYPRSEWSEYQERAQTNPDDAIITKWELTDGEKASLLELLGPNALKSNIVSITKGYYKDLRWGFEIDEKEIVTSLIGGQSLHEETRESLKKNVTVAALHAALTAKKEKSPTETQFLAAITAKFPNSSTQSAVQQLLLTGLPKMVYIPEYFRLPGQMSIEDLKVRQTAGTLTREHHVFLALLDMIGATVKDLEDSKQFERLSAELEAASNRLSREIFNYWSQNKYLRVQFRFDAAMSGDPPPYNTGYVVRTRIENTRHFVTVGFDDRSTGFVWFFSFLVWFSQARKNYGNNLVVLLDEPGLSLHAKAQSDLLRYIEERLAPRYQVIYTTHSPFMIDPKNFLRSRTVEDVFIEQKEGEAPPPREALGTKVGDKVLSTDRDTVFPLQAALGYEITQTLFIGEHNLLVEGPGELLYFEWFRRKLVSLGRIGLDRRWTVVPSGGIDKIPAFLSLFAGSKLHIAVFTDVAHGQKARIRDIRERRLLKDGHVLSADMYSGQAEADIEDVMGSETYCALVNRAYSLTGTDTLVAANLGAPPNRVVKAVENHFAVLGPQVREFDHFAPAEYLTQQGLSLVLAGLNLALDRFEQLFKDLNALL